MMNKILLFDCCWNSLIYHLYFPGCFSDTDLAYDFAVNFFLCKREVALCAVLHKNMNSDDFGSFNYGSW